MGRTNAGSGGCTREGHDMNQCATTLDDRIDHLTFALNQRATRFISEWYRGVQIEKVGHTPVRFEEMWVTYLAAEIYNNADAALICILHNRGRSARILERQMYEAYIKARFYADNPELARLEYLAMPFRDQHLEDQSGREKTSPRYQSILAAVAAVSSQWPEVAAYVQSHNKEIDLRSMVGPHGDDDVDQEYAFRYRRLSQTPHGSVSGMHDVFDYRDDGNIGIWFDGRLPDPTFALHSMTVMLIGFLEIMNRVHHLGRDEEVRSL
jgi:hypothetical protein